MFLLALHIRTDCDFVLFNKFNNTPSFSTLNDDEPAQGCDSEGEVGPFRSGKASGAKFKETLSFYDPTKDPPFDNIDETAQKYSCT